MIDLVGRGVELTLNALYVILVEMSIWLLR